MWTKPDPGQRPARNTVISERGFLRVEVNTGGLIGDDSVMIASRDNREFVDDKRIILDYEEAVGVVAELQRFIDGEDDFKKNYQEE